MSWKAIDRYSKDYAEMQTKDKVKFYKTPDLVLQRQLEIYDEVAVEEICGKPALQGDRRIPNSVRQAGDAMGAGYGGEPPHGVQSLFRAEREEESDD